jgi:hypothetical protein
MLKRPATYNPKLRDQHMPNLTHTRNNGRVLCDEKNSSASWGTGHTFYDLQTLTLQANFQMISCGVCRDKTIAIFRGLK